ncbi:DNA helicase, partial [Tanacetum coccineum]
GNELARTGVQSVSVGSVGRAPLSVETRDMPATTNVAVSTVFDRFRNMRLYSFGSHSVRQSAPIIHHVSVSTVDERGCVHTRPLITGSLQESSSSRAICGPGVAGYVGSSSRIAPSNHAYLCLDVADGVVRPKIVPFTSTRPGNTYEGDDFRENTCHTVGSFQHSQVPPTTPVSHTSYFGGRSTTQSSIKGHTPSYIDLGDCDQQCHHCGCLFWYGERIRNNNYARRVEYHLCCGGGKIYMRPTPDPPIFIQQLLTNTHFMEHIRAYNQMFAMTSFGAKVDDSVNSGKGPYVFKVSGQIYHWIGSLCPEEGQHPRFLQLYIYDTHDEVSNRMRNFAGREEDMLNPDIVQGLIRVLDEHNGLVRLFRTARDRCNAGEIPGFKIRLYNNGGARGYELPGSDVLGGIVFEDGPQSRTDFDVIIEFRGGFPKRINKLHQSYMSLQFPLLFVFGEPGYYPELLLKPKDGSGRGKKVTMNAYYKYQLHPRVKEFGLIFKSGRLFQQYVVATFCAIEQSRLDFIRKRQRELRSDYLLGLYDAISQGDREGIQAGSMVMLPRTFTGGPRYMYSHYLDALAICRSLGNPQFFVTFTCNVKWPEIKRYMLRFPGLTPADRADIVCRVFQQKVNDFLRFLKDERPFGYVIAFLYTVEFQKRGLPHCHTLLWVDSSSQIKDATQIDNYISAELPDPIQDPVAYKVVTELMMHGPCGVANSSAVCTEKGVCNKGFPKMYNDKTFFDINGHTHYRRRQTGVYFMKGESRLDNCNVVPYNRMLCLAFRAHINVEYCGWSMLIKYLFKYISKGPDRILGKIDRQVGNPSSSTIEKHIQVDEIKNYVDGRFICPFEACWRIFDYPIHRREPAVQILNVHLENMQRVNFGERDRLDVIVNMPDKKKTTLTECSGDLFYFRMLLSHQKGCKSPIEVRTINGQLLPTYRAACEALDPRKLWEKHWEAMKDDIPGKVSQVTGILNYHLNTPELQGHILYELEATLNGFGKSVKEFGLPTPLEHLLKDLKNKLLMEEKNYKRDVLLQEYALLVPKLNTEQKQIYTLVMNAVEQNQQEMLFVYGHGIASLLLPAGQTAHSRFKLPLELTDESICHAKKHSQLGNLLIETNLIIWDEAPMNDRRCFEALDRTLKDLITTPETVFGGKTVILGGDFQQTLPVKKGDVKQDLIHDSIARSYLWQDFKVCTLKQNMRLFRSGLSDEERERSKLFAKWLLDVGKGEIGYPDKDYGEDTFRITVPQEYCIAPDEQDAVNAKILALVEGVTKTYLSKDEAIQMGREMSETEMLYPLEYLNMITFPGFPPHELQLKVGSPIMLLQNVNLSGGLCNDHSQQWLEQPSHLWKLEKKVLPGKESEFPDHHFELISYNELSSRVPYRDENTSKMVYPILSDYLGCIRSISDLTPFRHANTGQKYRRRVDIESLDGNVVQFTMFDNLAKQFNKQEIDKLPHPVIIVVSSCRVTRYRGRDTTYSSDEQKKIPSKSNIDYKYRTFKEKYNQNPPLQVINYRSKTEQRKSENRQNCIVPPNKNPATFKDVRFTCDAMITSFNKRRSWSYPSCNECKKLSTKINGIDTCEDYGKQIPPTYRYNFTATVVDGTTTAEFTFFTEAGQKIVGLMSHASINKDKGLDTQLATCTVLTIQDSTSKDNNMPGPKPLDTQNSI